MNFWDYEDLGGTLEGNRNFSRLHFSNHGVSVHFCARVASADLHVARGGSSPNLIARLCGYVLPVVIIVNAVDAASLTPGSVRRAQN